MSKINILDIILAHYTSVFDGSAWQKLKDAIVFFLFPILCGYLFFQSIENISSDLRGLFVTVFSIFSALLFSAQIGLFALRRSSQYEHLADIEKQARIAQDKKFNGFLKSFSANTSYLIVISAITLALFVIEYIVDPSTQAEGYSRLLDATIISLAVHFFLTLLMVLKRFFVAYEASY